MIDAEYLRECLDYSPETGVLTWLERPLSHFSKEKDWKGWNTRYAYRPAGTINCKGYIDIKVDGTRHKAHRLAWVWMTGKWPKDQIDHNDLDKSNNRFSNLREATPSQNGANNRKYSSNTSGRKGVTWDKSRRKWRVQIIKNGNHTNIGRFDEDKLDEAASAYECAAMKLHGEFARTA